MSQNLTSMNKLKWFAIFLIAALGCIPANGQGIQNIKGTYGSGTRQSSLVPGDIGSRYIDISQTPPVRVRSAVESILDAHLPKSYDRAVFTEKCNNVFESMLNYASQGLKWAA